MMKKHGITLTMLAITIVIMGILATVITASIYSSLNFSKLATWANEIEYIKNILSEKRARSSSLDVSLGSISIDVSELSNEDIEEQFTGETIEDSQVELDILDLGKLGISNTTYGNKKTIDDVYAYSETTGKVYYVKGVTINNKTYYTLADSLFDMFGITRQNTNLTTVVFVPSIIGYTNQAVSVTVKVPTSFTGVTVTTSNNNILIGPVTLNGNVNEYVVNTSDITGNYTITVAYTNDGEEYTSTYEVNGYDDEEPTLNASKNENGQYVIQVSDNNSIKELKYIEGEIEQANIVSYFENNGKQVINGKFKSDENIVKYTVFAKDMAGNYSFLVLRNVITIDIGDYIEYDVAYTDMYKTNNVFSKLNGWRIVDFDLNNDGTYSNLKIISTGIPVRYCYTYNDSNDWYVTDSDKLDEFKSILTSQGDGEYSFYSGSKTYYALQETAGLYYNFGLIKFAYSENVRGHNLGYFINIVSNGIQYNNSENSAVEKTGNELFNLLGDSAIVRVLTLPEINIALVGDNIDNYTSIDGLNDSKGLYILNSLNYVPRMDNYEPYNGGNSNSTEYALASPHPNFDSETDTAKISNGGNIVHSRGIKRTQTVTNGVGLRPLIVTKSGIKVKFKDTNSNGVPEMQMVN